MSNNGTVLNQRKPIDASPNKFLLYGITYLMATPSDFSRTVVSNGVVDQAKTIQFLKSAGIEDDAHQEVLEFVGSIVSNAALANTINQLHDNLQSDFGDQTYSPTPCPNSIDGVSIMQKM